MRDLKAKAPVTLHLERGIVSGVDRGQETYKLTAFESMTVAEAKVYCAREHKFAPSRFQIWSLPDETVFSKDEHDGQTITAQERPLWDFLLQAHRFNLEGSTQISGRRLTSLEVGAYLEALLSKITILEKRKAREQGPHADEGMFTKRDVIGMTATAMSYAWQNQFCSRYPNQPVNFGRKWIAAKKRFVDEAPPGSGGRKQAEQEWNHLSSQLYVDDSTCGWEMTTMELTEFIRGLFFKFEKDPKFPASETLMQAKQLFFKMSDEQIRKQIKKTSEFFQSRLKLDTEVPKKTILQRLRTVTECLDQTKSHYFSRGELNWLAKLWVQSKVTRRTIERSETKELEKDLAEQIWTAALRLHLKTSNTMDDDEINMMRDAEELFQKAKDLRLPFKGVKLKMVEEWLLDVVIDSMKHILPAAHNEFMTLEYRVKEGFRLQTGRSDAGFDPRTLRELVDNLDLKNMPSDGLAYYLNNVAGRNSPQFTSASLYEFCIFERLVYHRNAELTSHANVLSLKLKAESLGNEVRFTIGRDEEEGLDETGFNILVLDQGGMVIDERNYDTMNQADDVDTMIEWITEITREESCRCFSSRPAVLMMAIKEGGMGENLSVHDRETKITGLRHAMTRRLRCQDIEDLPDRGTWALISTFDGTRWELQDEACGSSYQEAMVELEYVAKQTMLQQSWRCFILTMSSFQGIYLLTPLLPYVCYVIHVCILSVVAHSVIHPSIHPLPYLS